MLRSKPGLRGLTDSRTGDASDAGAAVAEAQSSYDLGAMRWSRLDAARGAAAVEEAARALLSL